MNASQKATLRKGESPVFHTATKIDFLRATIIRNIIPEELDAQYPSGWEEMTTTHWSQNRDDEAAIQHGRSSALPHGKTYLSACLACAVFFAGRGDPPTSPTGSREKKPVEKQANLETTRVLKKTTLGKDTESCRHQFHEKNSLSKDKQT